MIALTSEGLGRSHHRPAIAPLGARFSPRLTYAIAPPSQTTTIERRRAIAVTQSKLIAGLPIDALLVYDVQDEAARNGAPRPFPFAPKVDPLAYAFDELELGALPRVVYRATMEQDEASLRRWLDSLESRGGHAVFVGAPSRRVSSSLTLPEAFGVCQTHAPALSFGGVLIAERHKGPGTEDSRVWAKTQQGCRFFVSQTVWSVSATKQLLHDLRMRAELEGVAVPPLVFTLSPCGSPQTLEFLEWLGVDVPAFVKQELLSAKDMFARSIELATAACTEVRACAAEEGLVVGFNVESVSTRAKEVEASIELVRRIDAVAPRPESTDVIAAQRGDCLTARRTADFRATCAGDRASG